MKILLTEWYRDWRGTQPQTLKSEVLSLDNSKVGFALVVLVGNGDFDELCIESDSMEAKECVEGLLCGPGNARRVGHSSAVEQCRLHRASYDVYLQGTSSYLFVNPFPRPELFETRDLTEYKSEFKRV